MNFSGGKDLADEAMLFLIDRCKNLKKLNLDGCLKLTDKSLHAIAKYCGEKLLELNLDGVSLVSDAGIRLIAASCPNLRVLSIGNADLITDKTMEIIASNLKKIESLKISHCVSVTPLGLTSVIDSLPLKKLTVVEHEDQYRKRLLTSNVLQHIAKKRTDIEELVFGISTGKGTIKYVRLDLCTGFSDISANCTKLTAMEFIGQGFPQLHEIELSKESILNLIESNPGLTHINLAQNIDDDILSQLAKSCSELKAINLTFCPISNNALLEFSQSCKELEAVDLGYNQDINNVTFKKLVDNCPRINSLFITYCGGISYEGMEYAIQKLPLDNLFLVDGGAYGRKKLIRNKTLALIPVHCPNIKKLVINRYVDKENTNYAMEKIAQG